MPRSPSNSDNDTVIIMHLHRDQVSRVREWLNEHGITCTWDFTYDNTPRDLFAAYGTDRYMLKLTFPNMETLAWFKLAFP
jgi:hypothetical protein